MEVLTQNKWDSTTHHVSIYSISQEICTRFCCAFCFVVVMQSFIMNSHEVFIHIHQSCFAGTGAIARLPQCQWSKPDGYGKISQCITTTKHSKAKTMCIFLRIYCISLVHVDTLGTVFYLTNNAFNMDTEGLYLSIAYITYVHCRHMKLLLKQ